MLLRADQARLETDFRYVREMNLNTIRLEGKMETDEFYDLADEQGVLIMAGWCCCDHWELWKHWQPAISKSLPHPCARKFSVCEATPACWCG